MFACAIDSHPLEFRMCDFVEGLKELEKQPITSPRVNNFLIQALVPAQALQPYLFWNDTAYTRNLIYRDEFFEVLVLCWLPGQKTPVHSHNGQLGWMTVVQGEIVCRDYKFVRAGDQNGSGDGTNRRSVGAELIGMRQHQADGTVVTVDRRRTTHQLQNAESSKFGSVTLHVYSKPIDSCAVFDSARRCCERKSLHYYSVGGEVVSPEDYSPKLTNA
ncbi:MAG: cysteine dioxygenase family protein [Acidobacteriaceae bacterium]|nr:cysteine dioxygenase family protein [Acidobacteriaceae bacterium]